MTANPKASLELKWLVNDPCGTPAACTMSRTLALANPRSCTTRRPSVRIFSRFEALDMVAIWSSILACQAREWRPAENVPRALSGSVRNDIASRQARAVGQELLQPVDVIVAIDDVGFPHQSAEQRQRGLDAVEDEFIQRPAQPHQAFPARLAVDD